MELITLKTRTEKKTGTVKLRFRLREGRGLEIYHKSDIEINVQDLSKLTSDGQKKRNVSTIPDQLLKSIEAEKEVMHQAYEKMKAEGMDKTSEVFETVIADLKSPVLETRKVRPSLVARFRKYAERSLNAGIIGQNRYKHIIVVSDKLERFLRIKGISAITAEEFDIDHLMDFREFLFNEFEYVKKNPKLYEKVSAANKPQARLSMNTVTSQLKMLQTFFTELEDTDEIRKSPFRKLGTERRKAVMKTKYDDPYFLRKDEFQRLLNAEVPKSLEETRDAFLVQCAFGCRISDFVKMSMATISVSDEGIPYVHYIPQKTADSQSGNEEVQTPIVRYAFDIIKRTEFAFPVLRNLYGAYGYNARIKSLLQHCKMDRLVAAYNEETKANDYLPLYKVGSSKLARKTHVDLMAKVQIDKYAAGLHKKGSSAVDRYTALELKDRFALMNVAFEQDAYKVDQELNINQV